MTKFRDIVQEKIQESELDEDLKDVLKNTLAGAAVAGTLATAQPSMAANYQPTGDGAIADVEFSQMVDDQNKKAAEDMAIYSMVKNNTFNGIPLPSIYLLKADGSLELIKKFGYEVFKNRLS